MDRAATSHGQSIVTVATKGDYASNVELMRTNIAMQNRLGIDSRLITAEELQQLQPHAYVGDIDYVSYEPDSGYVDSIQATTSMVEAARNAGAVDPRGSRSHRDSRNRWQGHGDIDDRWVKCPQTLWSARLVPGRRLCSRPLASMIPISTIRVQIIIAQRPIELIEPHFVYLDTVAGIFSRPWGPGRSLDRRGGRRSTRRGRSQQCRSLQRPRVPWQGDRGDVSTHSCNEECPVSAWSCRSV